LTEVGNRVIVRRRFFGDYRKISVENKMTAAVAIKSDSEASIAKITRHSQLLAA
jgi:hypothetical protein